MRQEPTSLTVSSWLVLASAPRPRSQRRGGGGGEEEWPGDEAWLVFKEYSISSSLSLLIKESNL